MRRAFVANDSELKNKITVSWVKIYFFSRKNLLKLPEDTRHFIFERWLKQSWMISKVVMWEEARWIRTPVTARKGTYRSIVTPPPFPKKLKFHCCTVNLQFPKFWIIDYSISAVTLWDILEHIYFKFTLKIL